jgi:hypothetical protein
MLAWSRASFRWLLEARLAWLFAATMVASILLPVLCSSGESGFRLAGLALQIVGILAVAWGIHETRLLFERPSLFGTVGGWLERRPRFRGRVVAVGSSLLGSSVIGRARAHVTANPEDDTVAGRLDALEKNIGLVNDRISGLGTELDEQSRELRESLEQERQTRAKEAEELRARLEATETGGLHLSAVGAAWLAVGVTLSTAAPELARWLQ